MDNASKPHRSKPSLRLVTTEDTLISKAGESATETHEAAPTVTHKQEVNSTASQEPVSPASAKPELKSALARRLTAFADDLDKDIALLLAQ